MNTRPLIDSVRPGDRVTILDRFGKERTGRAVMRSASGGWVLRRVWSGDLLAFGAGGDDTAKGDII
jgi:hypothetical protein